MTKFSKRYTQDFKRKAIGRALKSGRSTMQVARELGINSTTLSRWLRNYYRVEGKRYSPSPYVDSPNSTSNDFKS